MKTLGAWAFTLALTVGAGAAEPPSLKMRTTEDLYNAGVVDMVDTSSHFLEWGP